MVEEVRFSLAKARLSAVMDDVVHHDRLKAVRRDRGTGEVMYLMARDVLNAAVGSARIVVDYLPDEDGMGIWLNDLEVGAHGADIEEARRNLVEAVRAYVANFLGELPIYLTWPDRARLVPQVLRLAIARDDEDLARLLFDSAAA
jgi:antitoxin of RelE/RelB toxin-antitoxin system